MKGQDKTPEKQLNEVEIGNLPEKELRIMIMKMIQDLVKTMKIQEMFTKDLQELKQKPYYRKLITMKKQKVMSQKKGQDKTPEK